MLDTFLKSHSDELTSIMGKCLVLQQQQSQAEVIPQQPIVQSLPIPQPPPEHTSQRPPSSTTQPQVTVSAPDLKVDNRPLIGDTIPEDPLSNLFNSSTNNNNNPTRYQDRNNSNQQRNNPNNKKGWRNF